MFETTVAFQSFIGIDLHKNTITLTAIRPDGLLVARVKIATKLDFCKLEIACPLSFREGG